MIAGRLEILGGRVECWAWLTITVHQYQLRELSLGLEALTSRMANCRVQLLAGFLGWPVARGVFSPSKVVDDMVVSS